MSATTEAAAAANARSVSEQSGASWASPDQDVDPSLFPRAGSLQRQRLRNCADEFDVERAEETLAANVAAGARLLRRQLDELALADNPPRV